MRLKALVVALALTACAGIANAGPIWFGVMGGAAVPTGDFSDVANTGFDVGGTGTWMVTDMWGVGADVAYHMWSGSDDANDVAEFITGDPDAEFKFNALQATANATIMVPMQGMVKPWLKGGLGIYNVTTKLESNIGDADESDSNFGFNFGAGLNWAATSNMAIGVGAAYHQIQTDPDATNLFTVNLNLLWGITPQ